MTEKDCSIHDEDLKRRKRKQKVLQTLLIILSTLLLASNIFWLGHNINRRRNKPKDSPQPLPTHTVAESHSVNI